MLHLAINCCIWQTTAVFGKQLLYLANNCCIWQATAVYGKQLLYLVVSVHALTKRNLITTFLALKTLMLKQ